MKCAVCSLTEEPDIGSVLIYLDRIKEVCFSFAKKIELLNRELKLEKELNKKSEEKLELINRELIFEKELNKKSEEKLQQSRKEIASKFPQTKRKKSLEVSDDFNFSNESHQLPVKRRANWFKKEYNLVADIPKRSKSKWMSKASLEHSLRKCSTPILKPKFEEAKTICSTKMKQQQNLDQMTSETIPAADNDNDEDSCLDATYCPEPTTSKTNKNNNFGFIQVKNAQKKTALPFSIFAESKFKIKSPDKDLAYVDESQSDRELFSSESDDNNEDMDSTYCPELDKQKRPNKTNLNQEVDNNFACSSKPIFAESKFKIKGPDKNLANVDDSSCVFMTIEADKVITIDESEDGILTQFEKKAWRNQDEKDQDCPDCIKYIKYIRGEIKSNKPVDQCIKHPTNNLDTPNGFWDPFFPSTLDVHRDTLEDNRFL